MANQKMLTFAPLTGQRVIMISGCSVSTNNTELISFDSPRGHAHSSLLCHRNLGYLSLSLVEGLGGQWLEFIYPRRVPLFRLLGVEIQAGIIG